MRWLVALATALTIAGVAFGYYIVLPAALKYLTGYDNNLYNIQIRAKDYYSFVSLVLMAVAIVFQVPLFVLGLVRIGVLTSAKLRRNWRIGIVTDDGDRRRAAGHRSGDDAARDGPVDLALPDLGRPLRVLRAPLATRNRHRDRMTELSADWVLPVDGPPIENGRIRFEDGRDRRRRRPARAARHFEDAVILPGFVNAHSHLEYSRYAGFGDGQPFGPWIALHAARKNLLDDDAMLALARQGVLDSLRSGITTTADYSFSGAAATAAGELGLRAIVYIEVFALEPATAEQRFTARRERVAESELVRIGISPHAPYTCSVDVYRWCLGLGIPVGTHLAESANENEWLEHGTGPLQAIAQMLVPPSGKRAVATLEPVLGPELLSRPLRRGRRRARSPCSPNATSRSPTARARTPCSAAASRRSRRCARQGSGWGSAPTRRRPRRRSTPSRRCGPPSTPRGRGRSGPRRSLLPTRSGSRRSMLLERCESTTRWVP